MQTIDIVIPTFKRAHMLLRTLESIRRARCPSGIFLRVIVVDNNSQDQTESIVREFSASSHLCVTYLHEARAGRSAAINAGVKSSEAEYVGFIDDDEELFPEWIEAVAEALQTTAADYLGGACVPDFTGILPDWLPSDWPGVLGDISGPEEVVQFTSEGNAFFTGGNGVIRRELFLRIGCYNPLLGRTGQQSLMSCEDRDLFDRLLEHGCRGFFVPSMKVWHHVPPERLTQEYFRRWAFDHGASLTVYSRLTGRSTKRSFFGVERWIWRSTAGHLVTLLTPRVASGIKRSQAFSSELHLREFAGRLRGRTYPLPQGEMA
ncbi:glycosyltransferase family 2 protein [Gemmatimonas sp.]|uniref:glycosyltransferase n=1 Tax=Gemmatimonas sp. TaxID=1962908 RepID=UPI003569EC32